MPVDLKENVKLVSYFGGLNKIEFKLENPNKMENFKPGLVMFVSCGRQIT